jgi:hypothetical protein
MSARCRSGLQYGPETAEHPLDDLSHLGDIEKRALMLADNKIAANAGWDRGMLAQELGELSDLLPEMNFDLRQVAAILLIGDWPECTGVLFRIRFQQRCVISCSKDCGN